MRYTIKIEVHTSNTPYWCMPIKERVKEDIIYNNDIGIYKKANCFKFYRYTVWDTVKTKFLKKYIKNYKEFLNFIQGGFLWVN